MVLNIRVCILMLLMVDYNFHIVHVKQIHFGMKQHMLE